MKFKKLFASVLAIALAAAAIPASPAKAATINGQTAYLNTEVYSTILPTTASQKFYLDPQGLADIATNGSNDLPTIDKGKVVGLNTMAAVNASSRPVNLEVKYVVNVDADKMDVVATSSAIATNATKPAICLTVDAKNSSAYAPDAVSAGGVALAVGSIDSVVASSGAIGNGGSGVQTFTLQAARYQAVTKTAIDVTSKDAIYNSANYNYALVETGASIDLEIGGVCSSTADYSAFTGSHATPLNLEMTFKFTKDDTSAIVDLDKATPLTLTPQMGAVNGKNVIYIPVPDANTSSINYYVDGVFSTNKSLIYNDGSNIGIYFDDYITSQHCILTLVYDGQLYKQQMW